MLRCWIGMVSGTLRVVSRTPNHWCQAPPTIGVRLCRRFRRGCGRDGARPSQSPSDSSDTPRRRCQAPWGIAMVSDTRRTSVRAVVAFSLQGHGVAALPMRTAPAIMPPQDFRTVFWRDNCPVESCKSRNPVENLPALPRHRIGLVSGTLRVVSGTPNHWCQALSGLRPGRRPALPETFGLLGDRVKNSVKFEKLCYNFDIKFGERLCQRLSQFLN